MARATHTFPQTLQHKFGRQILHQSDALTPDRPPPRAREHTTTFAHDHWHVLPTAGAVLSCGHMCQGCCSRIAGCGWQHGPPNVIRKRQGWPPCNLVVAEVLPEGGVAASTRKQVAIEAGDYQKHNNNS